MNEVNVNYLKDNIKYLGFGEKGHDLLEANIREGKMAFQLEFYSEINKKKFEAILQFRRSDTTDMYFLNSYKAALERNDGKWVEQTFYLEKGRGITAKEAYNLLEGRSVQKELSTKDGVEYKAWLQLDFSQKDKHDNHVVKQFHEKYGYDLEATLRKYPLQELDGGEKQKALIHSLHKGNIQSVTMEVGGQPQKLFIEANPQFKTINLYSESMQRMGQQQRQALLATPSVNNSVEQPKEEIRKDNNQKAKQKVEDPEGSSKKKASRKKGMSL